MEIISQLNSTAIQGKEQRTTAEQVRDAEVTARAVAARATGSDSYDAGANPFAAKVRELREQVGGVQGDLSRVQTEQTALRTMRDQLAAAGSETDTATLTAQLQETIDRSTYDNTPTVAFSAEELAANPQSSLTAIETRAQQLQQRTGELSNRIDGMMMAAENVAAAAGPAANTETVSDMINDLRATLPAGERLVFSGLTPEGVGALL